MRMIFSYDFAVLESINEATFQFSGRTFGYDGWESVNQCC